MQSSGIRTMQPNWAVQHQGPWLARFLGKLVLDILPAALASVIGGFLFTQYHSGHTTPPQLVDVQPASPEMMAMVRDEHALIINYLKVQMAAEQRRDQAEDAATARAAQQARAAADAKLADALFASQTMAQQSAPAPARLRRKSGPRIAKRLPSSPLRHTRRLLLRPQIRPRMMRLRRLSCPAKRASRTRCSTIRLSPGRSTLRTTSSPRPAMSSRSLAKCLPRSAAALAAWCPAVDNSTRRHDAARECSRRRTKWRLPPTHRAVQNRPTMCSFTTELPSIGTCK